MTDSQEATSNRAADDADSSRPSFAGYWKRSKEEAAGRNLTFVPSNPQQQPSSGAYSRDPFRQHHQQQEQADADSAQSRAQARRAQVRKAQIQHRQRKANYTKQLEMDCARLREQIEQAENESLALRGENNAIRLRLTAHGNSLGGVVVSLPEPTTMKAYAAAQTVAAPPEYAVTFDMSHVMSTPAFQVKRTSSSPSSGTGSGAETVLMSEDMPTPTEARPPSTSGDASLAMTGLSEAQTDQAINFILALEHICWNHFDPSYFAHADYDETANEHGHALMASAIALQDAPPEVFSRIGGVQERLRSHPQQESAHAHNAGIGADDVGGGITWQSTGLTLGSLYGLASTLNPPDRELAPVQAWFEIVRTYGLRVALDEELMDRVKAQFAGVVRCLHFGAVIERDAFDSVLARVVGPPREVEEEEGEGNLFMG